MSRPAWRTALAVLGAEGLGGALARAADRRREARRRASFARVELDRLARGGPVPVLNVIPFPIAARFGGVALQLADRLAAERAARPLAVLSFDGAAWRLEVESGGVRRAAEGALAHPLAGDDGAAEPIATIERAATAVGAAHIHLENLDRLPLAGLAGLAARRSVIVSTHDFALFCPRVQLLEAPGERFCGYCRDLDRCRRCLAAGAASFPIDPGVRRAAAARLVASAAALVHPSEFMRRAHADLFPGARRREAVIPPAIAIAPPRGTRAPLAPPRRIAFFGQASTRKGIADFARAAAALAPDAPGVEWLVVGGGEPGMLAALGPRGPRVTGAYRAGAGARALVRRRVDLAVLPSRFPEAHCLALDECLAAGVPVVAAGTGALGERVRALAAGWTFGAEPDALERALEQALREPPPAPRGSAPDATPAAAAAAHLELYASLDGAPPARP